MSLKQILDLVEPGKVAHLATASLDLQPHLVPVVYVISRKNIYIPLDSKPKSSTAEQLKRVKNIKVNSKVAFLVDNYEEDWEKLWFAMLVGSANLIKMNETKETYKELCEIQKLLLRKYRQYAKIETGTVFIKINVLRGFFWRYCEMTKAIRN